MGERWHSRLGALALTALMLVTACATGTSPGSGTTEYRHPPPVDGAEAGDAVFATLPTEFTPVRVGASDLQAALTTFWLHMPPRVATSHFPLYAGRELALVCSSSSGGAGAADLERSYGRYCERRGTPGDCLTLLEDGPRLRDEDKRSLALALAVGPALEGLDAEARAVLDPTRLLATLSFSITAYMALLVAPVPEPVTKGVAAAFTVLLWGYLGWEFFDLLRAYARLYDEAPRASTFAELREIGERFGRVIGPNSARILLIVGTAAIGETVALASKAPKLPGFEQASRTVEASSGVGLLSVAAGTERVIVSVPEGTIRVVLAPHVVAMATRSAAGASPSPGRGTLLPNGHRAWGSPSGFKSAMGPAGNGKEWHHIVEQTPGNVDRFGGEALHNTENVIAMDKALHTDISRLYSSIRTHITGSRAMTVRKWLSTQSYEAQRAFGLLAIDNVRNGIW
ncbi:MAG TPA: hypothetical protein VFZ09_21800 [Archangium sp.]|uniref:SitA5 family polymorphic toxin n=1 Tax=Archangium sp. TaxID=1872627 RepID=UPI002E31FF52|nr:hypothetical protein [Archangium sp.]HEX5748890.1 hypothetical protein [Archangium sp.]